MALCALGALFSCAKKQELNESRKVVVIGIDGAEWTIINRLVSQNRLPALGVLLKEGAWGDLESIPPLVSPAIWTTIATGRSRSDHGVTYFFNKIKGSYNKRINSCEARNTKALWNILTDKGLTVGVIGWHGAYPAEEVNGYMISLRLGKQFEDRTTPSSHKNISFYPEDLKERHDAIQKSFLLPKHPFTIEMGKILKREEERSKDTPREKLRNKYIRFIEAQTLHDTSIAHVSRKILEDNQPNLFMTYFTGVDAMSHHFWKHEENNFEDEEYFGITQQEADFLTNMVENYYVYVDHLIRQILEVCQLDTDVIILSDHGFRKGSFSDNVLFNPNILLADLKLLAFKENGGVDYEKTVAFNFEDTFLEERGIYLNMVHREPSGIIDEPEEETTIRMLIETLSEIKTSGGENLFEYVRANEKGKSEIVQEPDIVFGLNKQVAYEDTLMVEDREFPYSRYVTIGLHKGVHRKEGVVILYGNSFKKGALKNASILDVAPTVLSLLNIPKAKDMPGEVLSQCVKLPCTLPQPETYEGGAKRVSSGIEELSPEDEERLRALGYIR
jgi:predicted AlkP superfamily phosphohydrolase/phosphomutase